MTTLLDIHLLPVSRYLDREQSERSALYASEPPRRTARSRGIDRLVLYLVMAGDIIFPIEKQKELLAELSKKYYATPGSVTSAMKNVAEELNQILLERNRIASEKGRQGLGLFSQCVIREDQIYLAQSGPLQACWITENGAQFLSTMEVSTRGLGLVRSAPVNFSQVSYQPNSTLIITGRSDPSWTQQTWASLQGQGPEGVRRRLSNQAGGEFDVLIAQARSGKGKIQILQSRPTISGEGVGDLQKPPLPAPVVIRDIPSDKQDVLAIDRPGEPDQSAVQEDVYKTPTGQKAAVSQGVTPIEKNPNAAEGELPEFNLAELSAQVQQKKQPSMARNTLRSMNGSAGNLFRRAFTFLALALGKLFPEELFRTIPSSVMAVMAITIPLIVVTIASVAYFQLGRSAQYQIYFSQAEQNAIRAVEQSDLLDQRVNWIAALTLLDQAEKYQITGETQALRLQAQFALDNIDLIKRVDYLPAIQGGLPGEVSISRMVVSSGDLYLLDSKTGKVLRARPSTQGYQLDSSFQCGPTTASVASVSALIDIVAWPAGYEPKASVLGVDQGGTLAFCQPGSPVTVFRLALPQSAVGSLKAFDIGRNELFAMSQGTRAIWTFTQKAYDQPPRDYFSSDSEKPDNLDTTISFLVDRGDLYLLNNDGRLTYCSTTGIVGVPTRCQDANFVDMRPGRENLPLTTSSPLRQMMISSPPDPSLFFLESANHSIYHFSLRSLVFQRHYLPRKQLSILPATAFTFYPERRTIFLAIGNDIYYGAIP